MAQVQGSHTMPIFEEVLMLGPHAVRTVFDTSKHVIVEAVNKPLLLKDSEETQLPWEVAGKRWYCKDLDSLRGTTCKW